MRKSEQELTAMRELASAAAEYFDPNNIPAIMGGAFYQVMIAAQEARRARILAALSVLAR